MIVMDYPLYEQFIYEQHAMGKTVGLIGESNRLYPDEVHDKRIEQLKSKVDITIYSFNPMYENWVGVNPELAIKLYGKKHKDSVIHVIEKRSHTADFTFITPDYIPDKDNVTKWIYENAPLIDELHQIDTYSYIRGIYATTAYLSYIWKTKVDYIVSCPWELPYNIICHRLVNKFGVPFDFISGMKERKMLEQTHKE